MTSCHRKEKIAKCPCSYKDVNGNVCIHKGKCCACIAHHRINNELPACYFSPAQEKTYDRSISHYWHGNGYCQCHKEKE